MGEEGEGVTEGEADFEIEIPRVLETEGDKEFNKSVGDMAVDTRKLSI